MVALSFFPFNLKVSVFAFLSSEELPCTCPLCTSDRGSCVSTTEGIQLAKELGATYLELHSLDDFYIGKYFGGVVSGEAVSSCAGCYRASFQGISEWFHFISIIYFNLEKHNKS